MKLHCRSFPGQSQRPTPVTYDNHSVVAVVTPWNSSASSAKKIIQLFEDLYLDLSANLDHTRPFQSMSSLSAEENNIRMACMQINKQWFDKFNKKELNSGFESVFVIQTEGLIILAQIGNPQIYLAKADLPLQWIGQSSFLNHSQKNNAPLPHTLMGIFEDVPICIHSIKPEAKDQIFLVSRDFIPPAFLNTKNQSLESLGDTLIKDNPELPFWLGQLEINL